MRALFKMGLAALAALLLVAMSAAEAQRPMFHVRPPANWINDPNGPYRDPITGKMHLYMQYNPFDAVWGEMHWYHFTSEDYVTWQDEGIAMKNNQWYDHWGVYSGSITHNPVDGTPVMMYTCVSDLDVQRQCIAVPPNKDIRGPNAPRTLNTFLKPQNNPVLTEKDVPNLVGLGNFRDPTNFWKNPDNESEWLVAFVARINDEKLGDHGHVVVFKTADETWRSGFTYSHSLWHEEHDFHKMLECPDFFQLGGLQYMKLSTMISRQDIWVYGSYKKVDPKGKTVYVEDKERTPTYIDYGRWYASKHNYDPLLNRTILWGWIVEEIEENEVMRGQGWSGMMDMPRNVEYDEKAKKLKTYPMPELQKLRMEPLVKGKFEQLTAGGKPAELSTASGRHYELVVDFVLPDNAMVGGKYKPGDEPSFGVDVMGSADGKKYTRIAVAMPSTVDPGNDLTGRAYSTPTVKDEKECKDTCERERRCVAWTGVQKEKSYTCTLRSTVGTAEKANDTTKSGRVSEPVLLLDRTNSGTTGFTDTWVGRAPLLNGNKVQLRVFVDGTAVQVFKDDGRESLSARVYLSDKELTYVSLFASNIKGTVNATATLYPMNGVYAAGKLDVVGGEEEEEDPAIRDASGAPLRCAAVLLLALLALVQTLL